MKKAISVISAIMYLLLSTGIFVSIHYCHDRFTSFKVYGTYDNDCCGSSCNFSHKCCSFDTISVKITQEYFGTDNDISFFPKEMLVDIFSFQPSFEESETKPGDIYEAEPSPPEDIHILYCSLTFYG